MLFIYEDKQGERHELSQSKCLKEQERLGYRLVGHRVGGKIHPIERGHRMKAVQDKNNILKIKEDCERALHLNQLSLWGIQ